MGTAYISAISALAGSVIGGLISDYTTWLSQRSGAGRHDGARPRAPRGPDQGFHHRDDKTYGDAIVNSERKMPEPVDLYAMVSRMRVSGMSKTTTCADLSWAQSSKSTITLNQTAAKLRELTRSGKGIDPLKEFSEAAREKLRAFAMF